jgi:hypothetical protein
MPDAEVARRRALCLEAYARLRRDLGAALPGLRAASGASREAGPSSHHHAQG